MAQELINVGAAPNDGLGDPIRTAFIKTNNNFTELFGTVGGNIAGIANGTSNVNIATINGNITVGVGGTANITQFTTAGQLVTGTVTATGNIAGNYILGNGALLTGLPAAYSNANVAAYLPTYSGDITAGNVSATGNITAGFFTGNGAGLTGVIATSNVGAATQLANGTTSFNIPVVNGNVVGNVGANTSVYIFTDAGANVAGYVNATGNITGNYILGNGSQLTGLPASYGNANVAAYLPTYTGNIGAGNVSVTGNVVAGNVVSTTGTFRLPSFTTLELANITPVPGDMVYNTTVNQVQAWQYTASNVFACVSLSVSTYQ